MLQFLTLGRIDNLIDFQWFRLVHFLVVEHTGRRLWVRFVAVGRGIVDELLGALGDHDWHNVGFFARIGHYGSCARESSSRV